MFNINKSLESDYKPTDKKSSTTVGSDMYLAFIIAILLSIKDFVLHLLSFIFKPKPENIANQLALVTGGGNGLGRELSMRFAKEGCNIAIADLDYKNAQKTAEEIREKFKVKCMAFQCDISDNSAVLKMKNEIESAMQPVDILVNNAGLLYMSEFVLSDVNDIERVVSVNLTSQIKVGLHIFKYRK
ncbi:hypothetical protein PVAND_014198 [Polypedilum vanderplanki]|uniref:Uncharacterized protein n=1 Tax=Polypedilum vanderplanki TaxID=319348 RepID=A0A9J6CTJ2_POLVA|nr:hypothetical protein PVAND_014198 [Polypedilum vanderplanki]